MSTPTPEQIAAAILAYDVAMEGADKPYLAMRFEAMRAALEAAVKLEPKP